MTTVRIIAVTFRVMSRKNIFGPRLSNEILEHVRVLLENFRQAPPSFTICDFPLPTPPGHSDLDMEYKTTLVNSFAFHSNKSDKLLDIRVKTLVKKRKKNY